jgi:hypothetical protein
MDVCSRILRLTSVSVSRLAGGVEPFGAPRMLNRLECHATYGTLGDGVFENCADFVVVHALLEGDHERSRDIQRIEFFKRALANAPQVGAAQRHQGIALKGVELQVQLESGAVFRQAFGKAFLRRDAYAVRIHHQVPDGTRACGVENREEVRMDSRLTSRDLHHVRLAFVAHHGVEHPLYLRETSI